jgi:hypothetical protein
MSDKLELKLEISFFLDCKEDQKEKIKSKLDEFGWWILQEAKIDKAIKSFPGTVETGYNVNVVDLEKSI